MFYLKKEYKPPVKKVFVKQKVRVLPDYINETTIPNIVRTVSEKPKESLFFLYIIRYIGLSIDLSQGSPRFFDRRQELGLCTQTICKNVWFVFHFAVTLHRQSDKKVDVRITKSIN